MAEPRPALTLLEALERLHVSDSTVYRWRKAGDIRKLDLPGRTVRFHPDVIDAFLAGQARAAASSRRGGA